MCVFTTTLLINNKNKFMLTIMKAGSYKFSSRICCLIKSVCRQYECLQRTYFQHQKEKRGREILVEKRLRRKMEKVRRGDFWAAGRYKHLLFKTHFTPFLSEQFPYSYREVHLYVYRETEKEGSVTIYLAFIYDAPSLFLGTCTESVMLRFFIAHIKIHLHLFFM